MGLEEGDRLKGQGQNDASPVAKSTPGTGSGIARREFVQAAAAVLASVGFGETRNAPANRAATRTTTPPPGSEKRNVRFVENVWIPMSDGTRLGARLWLPEDAEHNPVPAVFDYHPYRQRGDATLASHGYAFLLPDIRGSGESEGPVQDEYVKQEQDDGVEIIAWLAEQPWCTGQVGMFGSSWSGFSALQVAARRPPALKAIITQCSTDDRYADDAHYIGGCIVQDMFVWGSYWTAFSARPPDPAIVGERWREMWMKRLHSLDFYVGNWLTHQHRDAFWKHASVNEDYSQIECAVYAVGGWVDGYHPAVPRLLAGLKCPRKGLIGPWTHSTFRSPEPAIDWLQESMRWWDYWLKGIDTHIMEEPMYRVWMQEEEATLGKHQVAGRWVAEATWPSERIKPTTHYLTRAGIEAQPDAEFPRTIKTPQTVGITAPHWVAFDLDTELPSDQRIDDARSLTFDSSPLQENLEILGAPVVTLDLSVDKPVAFLAVRLNEVQPTGESTRVTYAVLNLTQRDSREFPTALEPGKRYRIRVTLRDYAHVFKAGNRLRIALSTTYWPLIWPSPEAVMLTVYTGRSELELPVRPPRPADAQLKPFAVPETLDAGRQSNRARSAQPKIKPPTKIYEWDVGSQTLTIRSTPLTLGGSADALEMTAIQDNDPTSARLHYNRSAGFKRSDWDVNVKSTLRLHLTQTHFLMSGDVKAFEDDKEIFTRNWERKIPRDLV
jgi:putative CocE/NonD family hydrolase